MFDFLNPGTAPPQPGIGGVLNPGMDPIQQAFMLSAGLNLMNGGWGNPAQRVAQSLGAGVESAAGAGQMQEEIERANTRDSLAQQELDQRAQLNADDNTSRERVAQMYTDQRRATAGGGSGGTTLERQRRQFGARAYEAYKNNIINTSKQTPEELEAGARDAFLSAIEHYDATFGEGEISANPPPAGGPVSQPGAVPAPGKTSPNAVTPPRLQEQPYAPRGNPTAAPTLPSQGGTPISQVLASPKLSPQQKEKFTRLKNSAPGRQQLRAMGINPDG